jgi:pilus assembly protein Flp/PilA
MFAKQMVQMQMMQMRAGEFLRSLREDESGQGLVEYSLIIALVSVALIGALTALAGSIGGVFTSIGTAFTEAGF